MPPEFRISIAETADQVKSAQRLRYDVFVTELGAQVDDADHGAGLECDSFDAHFDHLLLHDDAVGEVVGVYRLLRQEVAAKIGQFYSEDEYDLTPLHQSGRKLLELGRSCLHRDYRGGTAMHHLWTGLAHYIAEHKIELLFGVASFHGTDIKSLAPSLSLLHHRHLAPHALRPHPKSNAFCSSDIIAENAIDRRAAMVQIPSLIKAYLRLGGVVGEGAFVDHRFNTTDVCVLMDTNQLNARKSRFYAGTTTR